MICWIGQFLGLVNPYYNRINPNAYSNSNLENLWLCNQPNKLKLCNFATSPICYGSHCCDAYHNFYCRNFKSNRRIWTSPVREIELSIELEKRVEMTSIMNLILDPAKLSRPCRVDSSGHLFHTFDWLANACHVRFIVRFNPCPVKNKRLVTGFPD